MVTISKNEFTQLSKPLLAIPVLRAWNSFGSAIHLNFNTLEGAAALHLYWDWRLEDDTTILCGSANRHSEISEAIEKLVRLTILEFLPETLLPDLIVVFSNGWRLRSMSLVAGCPQWSIALPDQTTLGGKDGRLVHSLKPIAEDYHPDPLAERISELAVAANQRWFQRRAMAVDGTCKKCQFFVPLDGASAYLWYGACACADSQSDGAVVHQGSGCEAFCPA